MNSEYKADMVDVLFFEGKKRVSEEDEEKLFSKFLRHHKRNLEVIILISLLLLGIICAYIGFFLQESLEFTSENFLKVTYSTFQLFVLQFNPDLTPPINLFLQIARFLCPIALYVSATLAILSLFHDTVKLILLVVRKNHVVVCGLNKRVMDLISDCIYGKEKVVIIEKDKDNENISKAKEFDATVVIGDYTDRFVLRKARVHRAKYLIAFTADDYVNFDIANQVNKILKKKREDFKCFIHVKDSNLNISQFLPKPQFQVRTFNIYQNSARFLFLSNDVNPVIDIWSKKGQLHFLIIGFKEMGENIFLQAANLGRYPEGGKMEFTIVDEDIDRLRDNFFYRYRNIKKICDISESEDTLQEKLRKAGEFWVNLWETVPFKKINFKEIKTKAFLKLEEIVKSINNITAVFVCFDDKSLAIQYEDCLRSILDPYNIPIYVQLDDDQKIIAFSKADKIYPFGISKKSCSREFIIREKLDLIAKAIHESYNKALLEKAKKEGKTIKVRPWEDLTTRYKNSNRLQADHNLIKLKTIGCYIERPKGKKVDEFSFKQNEVEILAELEHNRWCAEQLIYAKNVETEGHRDLKPFGALDQDEKDKDYNFIRKIPNRFENFIIRRKSNEE